MFSIPAVRLLFVLMSVQLVFIATHWEKYNTGVMYLSWGYDVSQYVRGRLSCIGLGWSGCDVVD